jgi:hypothetical protein
MGIVFFSFLCKIIFFQGFPKPQHVSVSLGPLGNSFICQAIFAICIEQGSFQDEFPKEDLSPSLAE